ncbi:Proline iminopeptidase [Pseudovibrio axinellae]|uniref:Proline iminopeptidase n=1 Tax=Pseudovibrio axinellae TaxID=989403 RepID=A0A165YN62_9HYPH|nr:alpha/beta hydrolase [Pseudovibrio axinellae]KZL19007.1 Proline iminopeptidase [Pseudovibrio axinellae]SEP84135.1 proline iminopeptidase [Pseudovibrio axinellae]
MTLRAKKMAYWILGSVMLCLVAGGAAFWWMMQQPLYKHGQAAKLAEQDPVSMDGERFWVEPNMSLTYFARGEGKPILYVHGGPGTPPDISAAALDALGENYKTYYYDQRGTGGSTRPFDRFNAKDGTWGNVQKLEGTLGLAQQLADMERIRKLLGQDRIIVVGHSFGAFMAALYAAEFPQGVDKLVLLNPADLLEFPNSREGLYGAIEKRLPAEDQDAFKAWLAQYMDFGNVFSKSEAELQVLDARFLPFYEKAIGKIPQGVPSPPLDATGNWQVRGVFFSMGRRHDWRGLMGKITAPTLVVHGGRDFQPKEIAEEYVANIPGSTLIEIKDAAHFPQYTHPEQLAAQLDHFLNDK